jgi:hypothetical protein
MMMNTHAHEKNRTERRGEGDGKEESEVRGEKRK